MAYCNKWKDWRIYALLAVLAVIPAAYARHGNADPSSEAQQPANMATIPPKLVLQIGHSDLVYVVAFSPDGRTVASGSDDHTVRLWDMRAGALRRTLTRLPEDVRSVAFSPDGTMVASGSADGTVRLWDAQTGALRQTLAGHEHEVRSVAFSPDGTMVASGSADRTVYLWNAQTGAFLNVLVGHKSMVGSVAFSPDGTMVASGGGIPFIPGEVTLWHLPTRIPLQTLEEHEGGVGSVAFSPDGTMVASGSADGTVRLWDTRSGQLLATLLILPSREDGKVSLDWIGFTPKGHYDGSVGAGRFITWRVSNDLFPVERYESTFHRPDLVKKALQGNR